MNANELTHFIIGAAIHVHRQLGPGEDEAAYEEALAHAPEKTDLEFRSQQPLPVIYKGMKLDCGYRVDLVVRNQVVIEIKSVERVAPVHFAQLMTYQRLGGWRLGILLNFNETRLKEGIHRRIVEPIPKRESTGYPTTEGRRTQRARNQEELDSAVIGAAIEMHRELGPGLLPSAYEACLCHELNLQNLEFARNVRIPLRYENATLTRESVIEMVVAGTLPLRIISADAVKDSHKAHFSAQLRHGGWKSGLLFNFNGVVLSEGIHRCFAAPHSLEDK